MKRLSGEIDFRRLLFYQADGLHVLRAKPGCVRGGLKKPSEQGSDGSAILFCFRIAGRCSLCKSSFCHEIEGSFPGSFSDTLYRTALRFNQHHFSLLTRGGGEPIVVRRVFLLTI